MKKFILLPFLVLGQFLVHAQKPVQRAQQLITMNLMPVGAVHLPKIKELGQIKGKDKKQTTQELVELSLDKNVFIDKQVIETVMAEKKPDVNSSDSGRKNESNDNTAKNRSIIYTITSL